MGVKLTKLIEKESITFDHLSGKRIAIDFSNFAFQFLSSIRQPDGTLLMDAKGNITSHLVGIWSRFSNLMQRNIQLAIVLDGKPPAQKLRVNEERYKRKEEAIEKYQQAKDEEDIKTMSMYARQFSFLTKEMTQEAVDLLEAMGLPVIPAPGEADAQMAYINKQGDVWATASSDYDCLVHGAPRLITNLTLSGKRKLPSGAMVKTSPELIELSKVLTKLDITQDQLTYMAILIGTDYSKGVHGIGPMKALKLVQQHKTPEKIFAAAKADFDWKEIYEIFVKMPIQKKYALTWKEPDEKKIKQLLIEKHSFSEERVDATLNKLLKKQQDKEQTGLHQWS
ncbi:MAG: flap endonuclease-1 [Nanoarchaeota archaeon]